MAGMPWCDCAHSYAAATQGHYFPPDPNSQCYPGWVDHGISSPRSVGMGVCVNPAPLHYIMDRNVKAGQEA